MKPFVFGADSHIRELDELFLDGLPASLQHHAMHARRQGDFLVTGTRDKIVYRMRLGQHREIDQRRSAPRHARDRRPA